VFVVRLHWLDSSFQEFKKETPLFAFRIIHTNDEQRSSRSNGIMLTT
jgi:hypothetical protein